MKQTRKWLLPVVLCTSLLVTGMGFVVAPKGNLVQVRLERNRVAGKLAPGVPANGGKVVQVIVEMSDLPVVSYEKWGRVKKASVESESTYRSHLQQKQKSLLREMKKRSPKLELKRTYDTVFSGIAVNVRADDVDRLAELPEVKKIYPVHKYKVMANEGDALVGAPQAWKEKDGSGRAVTGKGVKVAVIDTGVDTSHPDLKGKVVGGYDFVKNDPNPQDENGHGTHVAGIIAGNGKVKGVAPGASLLAYRVLDAEGIGTDANILAAIDQAVKDGANVMNLSLGSDVNVPEDPLSWALTRAAEQGVVAVVAAGNAGPDDWTVGSPGAAPSVISVGASTLKRPEPVVESVGDKKKFEINRITFSPAFPASGTYPLEAVSGTRIPSWVKGKVVLIKRPGADVDDLAKQGKKAGAVAVLVYNDESGEWFAPPLVPDYGPKGKIDLSVNAPTGTLSKEEGEYLLKKLKAGKNKVTFSTVTKEKMLDFSSRGPVNGTWQIKPDVVAPGEDITSTVPKSVNLSGYETMSGTSMATPFVAGAAALIVQKHPDWNPVEVKAALADTADNLINTEHVHYPYTVQGSGRINIPKALEANTLLLPNSLSFGMLQPKTGVKKVVRRLTIENKGKQEKRIQLKAEVDHPLKGFSVNVPAFLTVKPGGQVQIPILLTLDTHLRHGMYTGAVWARDGSELFKVPFIVLLDPKGFKIVGNLMPSDFFISPNHDGVKENIVFSYYLSVSPDTLTINAVDDASGKTYVLDQEKLPEPGYKEWMWDGKDVNGHVLPDGDYKIYVDTRYQDKTEVDQSFVTVDQTPPIIGLESNQPTGTVKGIIEDKTWIEKLEWKASDGNCWNKLDVQWVEEGKFQFAHTFTKGELSPGSHSIVLQAEDSAGNVTEKTVTVTIQ